MNKIFEFFKKAFQKKNNEVFLDKNEQALHRIGREQFITLKQKGLKIPIFTL